MGAAVEAAAPHVGPDHVVASVAAGLEVSFFEGLLPAASRVVRVMPNTPCAVREGVCSVTRGTHATDADVALVSRLLSSLGYVAEVEERLVHAVIGVAGSAPAYFFLAVEALADAGVRGGLPRDVAQRMAAQTMAGAGRMVLESGEHPGQLKDKVCSPGGTTIEAVCALEERGLRRALVAAATAAADKSRLMSAAPK